MASNRFAWERAVKASDLPPMTRLVLLILATEMDNATRRAAVTNDKLGKAAGVSGRTASVHLRNAIEAGWLTRLQRGHHIEGGTGAPSVYVGLFPDQEAPPQQEASSVSVPPQQEPSSHWVGSQPEDDDTQQEDERTPTGSRVPTSHSVHSSHCSSEPKFDDIDIEVHRQIKRKKDRGDIIRNERALRASIRQEIIAQRELDRLLAEREAEPTPYERGIERARALGRNLAGVEMTEDELFEAFIANSQDDVIPALFHEVTLPTWRERTAELRERSA